MSNKNQDNAKVGVSKGTIIRTIVLCVTVTNMILQYCGIDIIDVDENKLLALLEGLISLGSIITSWWYNNSFSPKARKADKYLKELRAAGYDEEVNISSTGEIKDIIEEENIANSEE